MNIEMTSVLASLLVVTTIAAILVGQERTSRPRWLFLVASIASSVLYLSWDTLRGFGTYLVWSIALGGICVVAVVLYKQYRASVATQKTDEDEKAESTGAKALFTLLKAFGMALVRTALLCVVVQLVAYAFYRREPYETFTATYTWLLLALAVFTVINAIQAKVEDNEDRGLASANTWIWWAVAVILVISVHRETSSKAEVTQAIQTAAVSAVVRTREPASHEWYGGWPKVNETTGDAVPFEPDMAFSFRILEYTQTKFEMVLNGTDDFGQPNTTYFTWDKKANPAQGIWHEASSGRSGTWKLQPTGPNRFDGHIAFTERRNNPYRGIRMRQEIETPPRQFNIHFWLQAAEVATVSTHAPRLGGIHR